jgi:hypothetical protein
MKRKSILVSSTAVLIIFGLSGSARAFSGSGSGTEADPYIITTVQQLQEMEDDLDAYYVLGNDIDASDTVNWNGGTGFEPVGTYDPNDGFTGTLDGRGHVITGLYIYRPNSNQIALFIDTNDAELKNLGMADVDITGSMGVGALVNGNMNSTISNCWSSGEVKSTFPGDNTSGIGGLVGSNVYDSIISKCYSTVNVTGNDAWQYGGLVGRNLRGAIIEDCYATGNVTGSYKVGGLVGDNMFGSDGGYVTRCYSTGKVTGNGGGLIGYNWQGGVTYDSYWDINTSGKSSSKGGTGKTTTQMMQQATFVNWDFVEIWDIDEGQSYPYFKESRLLIGLEISGPNEVAENFRAGYKAIAYYDDDSTRDVTDSAVWSVEPNMYASIEEGVLTTKDIVNDQSATILAGYTEGDVTVAAEKTIDILAICPTGTALSFDGVDDYVDCGNDMSLDLSEVTVSVWVKTGSTDRGFSTIATKGNAYDENYGMYVQEATGLVRFQFSSGGSYASGETFIDSSRNILDLFWHRVVGTFDGSVLKLYIDGSLETTGSTTTKKPDTNIGKTLTVGVRKDATAALYFNGAIDEVAIYSRALSAEEIWANMRRLTGDEPGLVGYWDFDEGHGQIVYDLSGNGNNGQLGSTPDVDGSDPAWIESDAPIGRCTPYLIATGSIKEALKQKKASLEKLEAALAEEWTAYEALEELLDAGDYGDLKKGDIISAKQRIHSAIQHQEQTINTLEKSINQLEDALIEIGYESEFLMP